MNKENNDSQLDDTQNESQNDHLSGEVIGQFIVGDLGDEENKRAEIHLAECDECLTQLADQMRVINYYARTPLSQKEKEILEKLPDTLPADQVKALLARFPASTTTKGNSIVSMVQKAGDFLGDIFRLPQLSPALAALILVAVGLTTFGGYRVFLSYRANQATDNGFAELHQTYSLTGDDFRPAGNFPHSIFTRERSAALPLQQDPAFAAFQQALAIDPDNERARLGLGTLYYLAGYAAKADSIARVLLADDSTNAEAWNLIGMVSQSRDDPENALPAFERACRLSPQFAEAQFNLAQALMRLGRHEAAIQAWKAYLDLDAESEWVKAARRHLDSLTNNGTN